jgi:hypothetical protein
VNIVRLLPVIISFGLLAAHFSRAGILPLMILSLIVPFILLVKKAWVARIVQVLLLLGGFEWIRAMLGYIEARKAIGDDWSRLAIILGAVALFTALSSLLFQGKALSELYGLRKGK